MVNIGYSLGVLTPLVHHNYFYVLLYKNNSG